MTFDYNKIMNNIKDHPFTLLSLSDREKFHTGFIAYAINNNKSLIKDIFGIEEVEDLKAYVERESIDLIIAKNDWDGKKFRQNVIAIAEIKFKSDLHSDQLVKYSEKVNEIPKKLISLFEPVFYDKETAAGFEKISIKKIAEYVQKELKCSAHELVNGEDEYILFNLWYKYIENLYDLVNKFAEVGFGRISAFKKFKEELENIKLKGMFERFRYAKFVNKLIVDSNLNMILSTNDREEKETLYFKIDNTHGNALLEFYFRIDKIRIGANMSKYGIQWQNGKLKLFIVANNANNNIRDNILRSLAKTYEKFNEVELTKQNAEIKLNRDGKFRSVTILSLDIFDNLVDHYDIFKKLILELSSNDVTEIFNSGTTN